MNSPRIQLSVIAFTALFVSADAQWEVNILHPANAEESQALGVRDGIQVGWARIGGRQCAFLWRGDSASAINLAPPDATTSIARGTSGKMQVGAVTTAEGQFASAWLGTAESLIQLNVAISGAYAVDNTSVTGWTMEGPSYLPTIGGTWTVLVPGQPGIARAIHGGVQGGNYGGFQRAAIWSGTPGSLIPLHTAGHVESSVWGVYGNEQVGYTIPFEPNRAVLWRGSLASMIYLGNNSSWAAGVYAGQQVGYAQTSTGLHAIRWTGQATPYVDLHYRLPKGYSHSRATGIWDDSEEFTFISGYATQTGTGDNHAVLWKWQNIHRSLIDSLQVIRGQVVSGNISSVQSSDDISLAIRPGITFSSGQAPVELIVEGTASILDTKRISLSVEVGGTSALRQRVEWFNFQTGVFDVLSTDLTALTDNIYRSDVSQNSTRYIQPGTGLLRARVSYFRDLPSFAFPWEVRIDRAWWHMVGYE